MTRSQPDTTSFQRATFWFTLTLALTLACGTSVFAGKTEVFDRNGATFRAGTLDGMVVTPDGRLAPGLESDELGRPAAARIWDVELVGKHIYAGTGDTQGLLRVLADGGDLEVIDGLAADPEILAVAKGRRGEVYVATGPQGSVYRIDPRKERVERLFTPEAEYVWDLQPLPDGSLALATGLPGRVMQIDTRGNGASATLWSTNEPHVRALALTSKGKLLAGTAGSGWVVEVDSEGNGFVVLDSERPEVAALAVDSNDTIWAAFTGSASAPSTSRRDSASASGANQTITVRPKNGGNGNGNGGNGSNDDNGEATRQSRTPSRGSGRDGGTVVRLPLGGEPHEVWSDRSLVPYALAAHPEGGVLLGTGSPAQIWRFDAEGELGMFSSYRDARAVSALAVEGGRVAVATSNPSILFNYGPDLASPARWTSDVFDGNTRTQFGRIHATVQDQHAGHVKVFVRAGNTAEPGVGWTPWREVAGAAGPPTASGAGSELPRSRFAQLRVEIDTSERDVTVPRVTMSYRRANRPPEIKQVEVLEPGLAVRAIPPSSITSGDGPVVTPPDSFDGVGQSQKKSQWRSKQAYERGALTVRWEANDPDGDDLTYDLETCIDDGSPCTQWALIAEGLTRRFYSFDSTALPDGVYVFRVTADDWRSNTRESSMYVTEISPQVLIDHTAPVIEDVEITAAGDLTTIRVVARDPSGRLVGAEIASASGKWQSIPAEDGVEDGDAEVFRGAVDLDDASPFFGVRVTDASGNVSVRQVKK